MPVKSVERLETQRLETSAYCEGGWLTGGRGEVRLSSRQALAVCAEGLGHGGEPGCGIALLLLCACGRLRGRTRPAEGDRRTQTAGHTQGTHRARAIRRLQSGRHGAGV